MITVDHQQLARAATTAAAPIGGKSPLPILNGLRIEASGGFLEVVGTDLTTIIRARCAAAGTLAAVVVPAEFVDRVRLMPQGPVTISTEGSALIISAGKRKFKLDTMSASDFPAVAIVEPTSDPIDAASLAVALSRGGVSMSQDQTRANLFGARFVRNTLRSMDGSQLSIVPSPVDLDAMIPPPAIALIAKFVGAAEEVRIGMDGNRAVVTRADAAISCQTVDSSLFPDFEHFFGNVDAEAPSFTMDRALLTNMVRAVSAAAKVDTRCIEIVADRGEVRAVAGDRGEDSLPCEATAPISFGVIAPRLLSVLAATDGDKVRVQSGGNMAPIIVEGLTTKHVVMPVWPDHVKAQVAA